jgi:hypothetical protein
MTHEELKAKAEKMHLFLEQKPGSEPNDIIERIELLSILISQSGECLAAAKYIQDNLIHSEIMKTIREGYVDKVSASVLNKLVNSLAKEENFLVNSFDRINSAAVHQLDGCRTILSYRKTEFATLSYQK